MHLRRQGRIFFLLVFFSFAVRNLNTFKLILLKVFNIPLNKWKDMETSVSHSHSGSDSDWRPLHTGKGRRERATWLWILIFQQIKFGTLNVPLEEKQWSGDIAEARLEFTDYETFFLTTLLKLLFHWRLFCFLLHIFIQVCWWLKFDPLKLPQYWRLSVEGQFEGLLRQLAPCLRRERILQSFDVMSSTIQRHFEWPNFFTYQIYSWFVCTLSLDLKWTKTTSIMRSLFPFKRSCFILCSFHKILNEIST